MTMAEMLNNGRVRFINDNYKTSEVVVLSSRIRTLSTGDRSLNGKTIFASGAIARAYECARQLEEVVSSLRSIV
jgi:hypothetical protein